MKAARALSLKNYPLAIACLEELLALSGENPHTLYLLALCHSRCDDDGLRAIDLAKRALLAEPAHIECLKLLGRIHFLRGEHRAARTYVARALELHAQSARDRQTPASRLGALASRLVHRRRDVRVPLDPREHRAWLAWAEAYMAEASGGIS